MQLYPTKALLNVGEIKRSSSGYAKGIDQLKRRLDFMEWAIRKLKPLVVEFVRVGHLYLPKDAAVPGQRPVNDINESIYLHLM